jgi:Protein of unknown function (DUF3179)
LPGVTCRPLSQRSAQCRLLRLLAGERHVLDEAGGRWQITEDALVRPNAAGRLKRVAAQRAFWFGWHAQFPSTLLIK